MGESYVLRRSRPLRFARMKVGPSVGTRYSEPRKAKIESPAEAYRAGNCGIGSMRGRRRNQAAVGTRINSRIFGRDRGRIACSCAMTEPEKQQIASPNLSRTVQASDLRVVAAYRREFRRKIGKRGGYVAEALVQIASALSEEEDVSL